MLEAALLMSDQAVILGVRSDPEPHNILSLFHCKSAVMQTNSNGPESADLLESQRRMLRVLKQQLVGLIREAAHTLRQLFV
jgi:hypothetical protein